MSIERDGYWLERRPTELVGVAFIVVWILTLPNDQSVTHIAFHIHARLSMVPLPSL